MTMKVFEVKGIISLGYSTDCTIVSAENEMQAYEITRESLNWYDDLFTFTEMMDNKYSHIKEMKDLEYKGSEPKILSQTCYVE